jgi:amino acid adenylation domain-containing protein
MPGSLLDLLDGAATANGGRAALAAVGGTALSYRLLAQESVAIAAALARAGVRRGDRVALAVPKSVEAIAGLWGILAAGAAYVPLDATAPPARAAQIAASAGVRALLASSEAGEAAIAVRDALPEVPLLQVHGEAPLAGAVPSRIALGAEPASAALRARAAELGPRDLAYVLYTSGSTGVPKGVALSHGASRSFVDWATAEFELTSGDVLSGHAPLHFDLSTFDVFAAAAAAAKLVVLDEETVRFPMASANALEQERISVWYSVPGALRRMLAKGRLAARPLPALRVVLFAGEVYPLGELRALQAALPQATLYNLYGPTETNVCTYWRVPPLDAFAEEAIPLGFACENSTAVVVDETLARVDDGAVGELLIAGGTLMDGYLADAERTAAAFVLDADGSKAGRRFYRTGDLVSRHPDGSFAFHGRRDHMVKIRGYRVELGEVEAALLRQDGVSDAAVVTRGVAEGEAELVAFVALGDGTNPAGASSRLRHALGARLPRYMVPAAVVCLSPLPVTANGKLDRRALAGEAARRFAASATGSARAGRHPLGDGVAVDGERRRA